MSFLKLPKVSLHQLFPAVIWSEISLLVPGEFFMMCENFHLPYHYALSLSTLYSRERINLDSCVYSLKKYKKCRYLELTSLSLSSELPMNLYEIIILNFFNNSTEDLQPLRACQHLRVVRISDFNGELEPLSACPNLQKIIINGYIGHISRGLNSLTLLGRGGCANLQEIEMDSFVGSWEGSLKPLSVCQDLRKIQMNSFKGDLLPLSLCINLQEIEMNVFEG